MMAVSLRGLMSAGILVGGQISPQVTCNGASCEMSTSWIPLDGVDQCAPGEVWSKVLGCSRESQRPWTEIYECEKDAKAVKVLKLCFKLTFQKIRCMQFRFSLKSCDEPLSYKKHNRLEKGLAWKTCL